MDLSYKISNKHSKISKNEFIDKSRKDIYKHLCSSPSFHYKDYSMQIVNRLGLNIDPQEILCLRRRNENNYGKFSIIFPIYNSGKSEKNKLTEIISKININNECYPNVSLFPVLNVQSQLFYGNGLIDNEMSKIFLTSDLNASDTDYAIHTNWIIPRILRRIFDKELVYYNIFAPKNKFILYRLEKFPYREFLPEKFPSIITPEKIGSCRNFDLETRVAKGLLERKNDQEWRKKIVGKLPIETISQKYLERKENYTEDEKKVILLHDDIIEIYSTMIFKHVDLFTFDLANNPKDLKKDLKNKAKELQKEFKKLSENSQNKLRYRRGKFISGNWYLQNIK